MIDRENLKGQKML